ncbi:modular serine protease-like isoform X2 [Temnothorax nylanderi]|uniref:modular serine protease-like isoform X2 n=1 Tax=Temnothorax nylanderi TaxID=102681 RepID=UPI003A849DA1
MNGTVASAEGHAVDRFRGEAGCSTKEIAVVAPDDSDGDSSTQCSDVINDGNEEEETDVEESGAGGWIMNPPVSTIVQQHQAFDTTNGYIALPNPDSSNFSDVRVKDSSNVHLGNEVNYNGPVTIHVNHVVYTNPTPNQDAIELDVICPSDNISDLSTNKDNGAPNGCIFPQNTKLNKVTQWLWTWKRVVLPCVITLILLAIVVPITVHFTRHSDASMTTTPAPTTPFTPTTPPTIPTPTTPTTPEIPNSSTEVCIGSEYAQIGYTQTNNCGLQKFRCCNGDCIASDLLCDGKTDCRDKSDETEAECKRPEILCPNYAFRCAYGACIDGDLRCNGVDDCADSSDEDQGLCRTGWPSVLPSVRPTTGTTRSPPTPAPTRPSGTPSGTNTCKAPPQPQNGRWKLHRSQCSDGQDCNVPEGTELGLGSYLVYSCDSGYKIRGSPDVSCSIGGKWLDIPVCTAILCKALAAPSIRHECRYDDEWISCKSPVPPRTEVTLSCENSYRPETNQHLLSGQGTNVRCNANGEWEPEPIRCVPVCGTLPLNYQPKVVGGFRPNITEFPWHASMYRDEPGEPKKYFCGASIIQENLLITAAHCVYDENNRQPIDANKIYILAGNLFRDYITPFHDLNLIKRNQVKRIYIARDYLGFIGNYLWDVAVLELVTPFVLSSYLVPACIDTLSYGSVLEPGTYGKVAGFGRTATGESSAVLQALTVPVISVSQCRSASQSVNTEQFITNDKFCAGYTNGSSVSDGDSGGGLVFKTNNLWYLREISRYIPWIQDVMTKIEQNQTHTLCSEQSSTRCS